MSEAIVGLHFGPKNDVARHDRMLTTAYSGLIQNINELGHEVVITRGAASYDDEEGVINGAWAIEDHNGVISTTQKREIVGLDSVGAIRNFGDLAYTDEPRLLNHPAVRAYDRTKLGLYIDVLQGIQVTTAAGNDREAIDALEGDRIVIKPDNGFGGKGVQFLTKSEAVAGENEGMVAQPFHTTAAYMIPGLRGQDPEEQAKLANLSDLPKELRLFCSSYIGGVAITPVMRLKKPGDKYHASAHIEPDSVPSEAIELAELALSRLHAVTAVDEIYAAVDVQFGKTANDTEPQYRVGEMNLWKPIMNREKPVSGRLHDRNLARQLVRMARKGRA